MEVVHTSSNTPCSSHVVATCITTYRSRLGACGVGVGCDAVLVTGGNIHTVTSTTSPVVLGTCPVRQLIDVDVDRRCSTYPVPMCRSVAPRRTYGPPRGNWTRRSHESPVSQGPCPAPHGTSQPPIPHTGCPSSGLGLNQALGLRYNNCF